MKALIVYGGWAGHQPDQVAAALAGMLREDGVDVEMSETLEVLADAEKLLKLDLIVPVWTMGKITGEQLGPLCAAVEKGVGLAGLHGGMGDAFREATQFQFMVGGQWVAHPGNILDYRVHVVDRADPITAGVENFDMHSEQYYMHVDPIIHVLAATTFEFNGCTMPVVWKKTYGRGRVFYSSLGHVARDLDVPEVRTITRRGFLWAAEGGSRRA